jgi:hypothetical protein
MKLLTLNDSGKRGMFAQLLFCRYECSDGDQDLIDVWQTAHDGGATIRLQDLLDGSPIHKQLNHKK